MSSMSVLAAVRGRDRDRMIGVATFASERPALLEPASKTCRGSWLRVWSGSTAGKRSGSSSIRAPSPTSGSSSASCCSMSGRRHSAHTRSGRCSSTRQSRRLRRVTRARGVRSCSGARSRRQSSVLDAAPQRPRRHLWRTSRCPVRAARRASRPARPSPRRTPPGPRRTRRPGRPPGRRRAARPEPRIDATVLGVATHLGAFRRERLKPVEARLPVVRESARVPPLDAAHEPPPCGDDLALERGHRPSELDLPELVVQPQGQLPPKASVHAARTG